MVIGMRTTLPPPDIEYPETDGQPMANNTIQAEVMMTLKENLEAMFRHRNDVFIAIDLFWYPVKGNNQERTAPDVMVVFGRPKGHRRSYKQWEEDGIAPQVVFEVVSESNSETELEGVKKDFYEQHGAEEYYIYNPDTGRWKGFLRRGGKLQEITEMEGWVSPRLGIRFGVGHEADPGVYDTEGNRFPAYLELREALEQAIERERQRAEQERRLREQERQRAEQERQRAEQERQRAEQERQRAEQAQAELERLKRLLQERGIHLEV
ncbi:MAG: Uma2 family endonuclease [Fimbriimonadales bacterium]|nr:Uma2 family endonuclease [Fimbriimonadales bacterium]